MVWIIMFLIIGMILLILTKIATLSDFGESSFGMTNDEEDDFCDEYNKAIRITEALFKGNFSELSIEELEEAFKGNEVKTVELGKNILDILVEMNVASSKRQAREFISGNSIEIKGEKVKDLDATIDESYLTNNTYLIIKRGKKNYYVGKINK